MNYKDFENEIISELSERLPEYAVSAGMVPKPTGEYYGVMVRAENGMGMSYNMWDLYRECGGVIDEDDMEELVDVIREGMSRDFKIAESFLDYNVAKEHLFLMAEPLNYEVAERIPFISYGGDIMFTFRIVEEFSEDGMMSAIVTHRLADGWKVDKEKLMEDALKSSVKIAPVEVVDMHRYPNNLLVVTNEHLTCGASAVMYPGVLEELSEKLGSDLYVIPSSIHEMVIVPTKDGYKTRDIKALVKEMNREIGRGNVLSNCVYYYNEKDKIFGEAV